MLRSVMRVGLCEIGFYYNLNETSENYLFIHLKANLCQSTDAHCQPSFALFLHVMLRVQIASGAHYPCIAFEENPSGLQQY